MNSVRVKTLGIIAATLVIMIAFLYFFSSTILLKSFKDLQEYSIRQNVLRALSALSEEILYLGATCQDWAMREDTRSFILDPSEVYVQENWSASTMTEQRLNFAMIIDSSNQIIFKKSFDLGSGHVLPLSESLTRLVNQGKSPLFGRSPTSNSAGILILPESPALVAVEAISDKKDGLPLGILLIGRYLNSMEVSRYATNAYLYHLTVRQVNDPDMPEEFRTVFSALKEGVEIVVRSLDSNTIAGYTIVNDIYGNPGLFLKVDEPQRVLIIGKDSIKYYLGFVVLSGIIFGLVILLLMEKMVLSRLVKLKSDVIGIGMMGNSSKRVKSKGSDELSRLADSINEMLNSLEMSRDELQRSEEKFRSVLENSSDTIYRLNLETSRFDYISPSIQRMTGFSPEEVISSGYESFRLLVHPDDRHRVEAHFASLAAHLDGNHNYAVEYRIKHLSRGFRWVRERRSFVFNGGDKPSALVGNITDIMDLKNAEEKIRASLREKEVLLEEVHHRVKNNMQVISSLLNLQSGKVEDQRALDLLKSSRDRVRSMALVHERLYRSKDFSMIDFADYVRLLTVHLQSLYRNRDKEIDIQIDIGDIKLDMNTAIPCGLIVNELVSNALKHAFPNRRKGIIQVAMHCCDDVAMELRVNDDGIGMPEDVDFRSTESLGLQLVTILGEDQLQGKIILDRNQGTRFCLKFDKKDKRS